MKCERNANLAVQPYQETWNLSRKENGYCCVPDLPEQLRALQAVNRLQFRALSVGCNGGQVAIIPLDESSVERGQLIACVPEMARMLMDKYTPGDPTCYDIEKLLRKAGVL